MKKLIMTLLLGVYAFAQDGPARIVELKYLDLNSIHSLLGALDVHVNVTPGSHLFVLTGSKENVSAAEQALKRIDMPRKNIELTFQVLDAMSQPGEEKIPADLEAVVKQLRNSFVYKGFRLVDTLQLRTQEGANGSVIGAVPREKGGPMLRFLEIGFLSTAIADHANGSMVHLEQLNFRSKLPNGGDGKGGLTYEDTGIHTSIDIPDGTKVVVGKANMDGEAGAYFLIVTAKVVN